MTDRQTYSAVEQSGAFHRAADDTDDAFDHDTLHAAGAVVLVSPWWSDLEYGGPYVTRWLDHLWDRFVGPGHIQT